MKTLYIATLKDGWHNAINGLTEKAHEVLTDVKQIILFDSSIEEAKQSIEDGFYSYLPPRWDDAFTPSDNLSDLIDFCSMIRELHLRAFPLTVEMSDVEKITAVDVTCEFYSQVRIDYEDIRVNDIETIKIVTNLVDIY